MSRLDRLNARLGARRPGLLDGPALRAVLAGASTEARLERLRATAAGAALPAELGAGEVALARAEAALLAARQAEAAWLLGEVEGRRARGLLRAFLGLDEAEAVKAVLRGVTRGAPIDAILAAAPPSPALSSDALRAAAAAPGAEAALDLLVAAGSEIAAAARAALAEGAAGPAIELAADRAAQARAVAACRGAGEDGRILARHLADRADARNAATLLALSGAAPAEACWLPGGARLDEAALTRLAAGEPEQARRAVAAAFGLAPEALATPWGAEVALERALLAPLRRASRLLPLSLAVPLRHLLERRAEARRAAVVLRAAAVGVSGEELLELVEA